MKKIMLMVFLLTSMYAPFTLAEETSVSNEAINYVESKPYIKEVIAVHSDGQLLVAYKVRQWNRFRMKKIEEEMEKELKKKFPKYHVVSSNDWKIFLETSKLKEKVDKLSEKEIHKKIDELEKLSKEEA